MKLMPFKIAVIGCGWVSMDCHGPAYTRYAQTHPNVELTACCDLDPQKAEAFRQRFGFIRAYAGYQELLDTEKPDAVCLNVPPEATCSTGCAVLEQGYPLLCEKPPGIFTAEVDRLIAAAERSGALNQVAFNRRFMPLVAQLKSQLSAGPAQAIEIVMARYRRLEADFSTTAVHAVDLPRFLLDCDYQDIHLHYSTQLVSDQPVTNFPVRGTLESGAAVNVSIYPATGMNIERLSVYCAGRAYLLACSNGLDTPGWLCIYQDNRLVKEMDGAQLSGSEESYILNGFYAEDAAFFEAVQTGKQPHEDLRSARQSVEIMQALRERRGRYQK